MFLVASTVVLGMSMALAAINKNDVDTRYFIGLFNGDSFPLSIDTCNPLAVAGSTAHTMATCVDSNTASYVYYTDSTCTTEAGISDTYNSSYQTADGSLYDFVCDTSYSDSYAAVYFTTTECDSAGADNFVLMNAAVDACANLPDDTVSISIYCSSNYVEMQYYAAATTTLCVDANVYQVVNGTDECSLMLSVTDDATGSTTLVYGYSSACYIDGTDVTVANNDSDSGVVVKVSMMLVALIGLSIMNA